MSTSISHHSPRPAPAQPSRPRHFSMLRELSFADIFTLGNAACGTAAIFFCLTYLDAGGTTAHLWLAFALLPVALACDILDGGVARKRRASRYGADLDSLADIVSFGVAPATLAFTLGMRGGWDMIVLIYFVVCGISRLARYNVTADTLKTDTGKVAYYEGTPIPSSLTLVAVLAVAFAIGATGTQMWFGAYELFGWTFHPLSLMFLVSGTLMASATVRIPKL